MRLLSVLLAALLSVSVWAAVDLAGGSSDIINTTSATGLDTTNSDFSLAFWFKQDTQPGTKVIFEAYQSGSNSFRLMVYTNTARLRTYHGGTESSTYGPTSAIAAGTYYYVMIVYTTSSPGGNYAVYIDDMATPNFSVVQTADMTIDIDGLHYGADHNVNYNIDGRIAYAGWWNRALSEAERVIEKAATEACLTTDLVSDWRFGVGAVTVDSYGSNTLALGGGAAYSSDEPGGVAACPGVGVDVRVLRRNRGR